jgi:transposase-like protein
LKERRTFTQEFKDGAVAKALAGDLSIPKVAEQIGLNPAVLRRWVKDHGDEPQESPEAAATEPDPEGDEVVAESQAAFSEDHLPSAVRPRGSVASAVETIRKEIDSKEGEAASLRRALALLEAKVVK